LASLKKDKSNKAPTSFEEFPELLYMEKLSTQEIDEIAKLLRGGSALPVNLVDRIFDTSFSLESKATRKECELTYSGKDRVEDILADTMAVPLQKIKSFASEDNQDDWSNMLILGDNLQVLKTLLQMKQAGQLKNADGTDGVRLIYIDPPFATSQEFKGSQDQKAYQDKIAGAQFLEFLRKRLVFLRELLSSDGSIYVHLDWKKAHYVKILMDELFGEQNFTEIVRRTVSAHNDPGTMGNIHDTILLYKASKQSYFAPPRDFSDAVNKLSYNRIDLPVQNLQHLEIENLQILVEGHELSNLDNHLSENPELGRTYVRIPDEILASMPIEKGTVNVVIKLNQRTILDQDLALWSVGGNTTVKTLKGGRYEYAWRGISRIWRYSESKMQELEEQNELWYTSAGIPRKKVYYKGKSIQSIWGENQFWNLQGNDKENTGYPTQKPEALLDRIINTSSKEGDLVVDCFSGSGTTLAVADKSGRRWIGVDCGKLAVYTTQKRLLNIANSKSMANPSQNYGREYKPFSLYNAGLYDYEMVKGLPWQQYRDFALKLFQCRDEKHEIANIELDGYLGSDNVLVYNYRQHPNAVIDRLFIEDIHNILGERVGGRFFIIAPAAAVQFFEDYITKAKTKYFVLRIPYSIIEALYRHGFGKLKQPTSEIDVNDTIDAVGFDFIQMPRVECTYFSDKKKGQLTIGEGIDEYVIRIEKFESNTISRKPVVFDNLETLSMVMMDYDFNGAVFDLDQVFYAENLKRNNYEVRFSRDKLKKQLMIIYMDIFGNEKREIKTKADFIS
jgi:site-specific DNA-methyltransferase (adenine-specific)/adenine-specific DNA-methyltransferase